MPFEFTIERFGAWLCDHQEDEQVGEAGRCFSCPLALWLSEVYHCVYGVDGTTYGPARQHTWQWKRLPRWAIAFTYHLDTLGFRPLTTLDTLAILAQVEFIVHTQQTFSQAA